MPEIEIVYGLAQRQKLYRVHVEDGCTVREAVSARAAEIGADFPDAALAAAKLGIFGKAVADDTVLQSGDRVEIYRPLIADPKAARRQRALKNKGTI